MLGNLFGKKKELEETIVAPATGKFIEIEEVPDAAFSQKMMGDGFAIEPTEGEVVSPIDGEVVQIFPTKHAVGIQGKSGIEVLVHIGLETVSMNGEGFKAFVKQGDRVKAGQCLITFDLDLIKEKATSAVTPIVITNSDKIESLQKVASDHPQKGKSEMLKIKMKG
ncbi:PTS sugar transporter subunit IIA [Desertibacillus haloalkaliphilus]|uniref:PTS sugar transporter subunit IIA n=1 Tax=Desertibacillus haloalkaliphilus TaxID=1328930 RepID=UPI001C251EB9|nr:PTS glucose transporter subunit IIA [Desertibacillus haloalkaliphilus]MBU8906273.1 PTS glucose transporter subunit IIA [Desertibacillus haloalkaliphilus]